MMFVKAIRAEIERTESSIRSVRCRLWHFISGTSPKKLKAIHWHFGGEGAQGRGDGGVKGKKSASVCKNM